jgi:hypothetical protein
MLIRRMDYYERPGLPLLIIHIDGAPHRRQHYAVIAQYRDKLYEAGLKSGLKMPIRHKIAVRVLFINPCSPDYDNLVVALWRALDGNSHIAPTVLADDSLIEYIDGMGRYFPYQ